MNLFIQGIRSSGIPPLVPLAIGSDVQLHWHFAELGSSVVIRWRSISQDKSSRQLCICAHCSTPKAVGCAVWTSDEPDRECALALALQFFRCFPISCVKVTEKMQRLLTEWRRGAAPLALLVLRQCPTAALTNPKSRNLQKMTYLDVNYEVMHP